jgi:hypothetical protein
MVTIPPTISQYASSYQKQNNNTLTLNSSNVPHCPVTEQPATFKKYAEFHGPSPALAETINMSCCHFMTIHMQQKLDRLSSG